jgi:hypothetical protein
MVVAAGSPGPPAGRRARPGRGWLPREAPAILAGMEPGTRLRRREGVLFRPEEDEAFLFDPDTGALKLLNATGVEVWGRLATAVTAAEVAADLGRGYPEAEPGAVAADVDRFLEELVAAGLAELVPGG